MHKEWYNTDIMFYKSDEIFRESRMLLVGTSAPILGVDIEKSLQDALCINKEVNLDQVIKHLKTCVRVWDEKKKSTSQYIEMLKEIYVYLSKRPSQEDVSRIILQHFAEYGEKWIWHGAGFCAPEQLALEKDLPFEFRPPLFLLPEALNDGKSLTIFFRNHGVREQFSKEDIISVLVAIKKTYEETVRPISLKEQEKDLKFCRSVLEWLVSDGQKLDEDLRRKIFVPVQKDKKLVLEECEKGTYCDQEWLKHGKSELDIPDDIQLIHDSITTKTAILLGVPSLSSCLLSAECVEFEQTGPYEPITTRIKNILKEYKEGVGIFKELIQNADDAGADTVKFLVDWRTGKIGSLFSPDMAPSQGPALWAYNNAVFTDKDFENINKLAGGTKVEDLSKIGRFGLGFNAVYHLTDVPSFISRSILCIFDPNVNHISNHIRDKSRPGIRIDLAKNPRPLTAFADQFSLYNEIFECKTTLDDKEKFSYQGTLFRFPFRTATEAEKSEMCQTVYNQVEVKRIVDTLQRNASLILLFTQNVKRVELYELAAEDCPQNMKLILSINKEVLSTNKEISTIPEVVQVSPYIKRCSNWWNEKQSLSEAPWCLEQVEIRIDKEDPTTNETGACDVKTSSWFVSYCVGKDLSIKLAREEGEKDGLLPLAGAAALLQSNSNDDAMIAKQVNGEAFCFLPLSISTGLPVHVNSSFAVRSNRDGIWEKTTAEENLESRWNETLLQDAIPEAYFQLLHGMVNLSKNNSLTQFDQRFHDFWPRLATSKTSWTALVSSFYTKLLAQNLKLFCSTGKWMDINDGFILDDELRSHDHDRVVRTLKFIEIHVFDLPSDVVTAMKDSASDSVQNVLQKQTLNFVSFFELHLFPKLEVIPADLRNPIVHDGLRYLLDETKQGYQKLNSLYKKTKCIPCSPDGEKLARPCDLINPNDESISRLYSPEEGRFPHGNLDNTQMFVLAEKLGMVKDLLSWEEIRGRAMSIEKLAETNKEAALLRSRYLVYYLRCNMERLKQMTDISLCPSLQKINFLPVRLTATESYTLPWKGESCSTQFLSPGELFLPEDDTLIGSASLIVDDTEESGCGSLEVLKSVLGFSRRPSCQQVFEQLDITRKSHATDEMKNRVCKRVYKHLNDELDENSDVTEKLQNSPWLYLEGTFVENKKIAMSWNGYAVPFLYSVPDRDKQEYKKLLKLAGIKECFTATDFIEALDLLRESMQDTPLSPEHIQLVVTLIRELRDPSEAVRRRFGTIPLPDTSGVLYDSKDLTIPESFAVKYNNKGELFIHQEIVQNTARKLGAKALRARRREKYGNTMSISFGQFEKLTDRIKNILESYPCDAGILKELVQNADDAKATEIQFIYDKRKLPHERVLQNQASEIQGPALCVYNNKQFSEDDFNGICKLGIGSKHDDPAKTGQYGIGFNAVYHLTDCPSFLSNDSTLCILDPHCEYAPEATLDAPGGRYDNIDNDFRDIFSDTVSGYLKNLDRFPLKNSTMFRLPLRTSEQAAKSEVSRIVATEEIMTLLKKFEEEAKKLLLFLNHVKEIGLWEIDENSELKLTYSVSSKLKPKSEKKLHELHGHLQDHKNLKTHEILIKDTTYSIHIQDTERLQEKWLIHQIFGIREEAMSDEQTPNVCDLGLFPRGGIAALLSTTNRPDLEKYVAYCFLPLPVTTSLPVHVNGHFALDGSRRDLWWDQSKTCRKTNWNGFMKEQVLGPAYASLITKIRKHIPYCERESEKIFFSNEDEAIKALVWYHKLFPDPEKDPDWNTLAVAVYKSLKEAQIFPVVSQSRGVNTAKKHQSDECGSEKSSGTREGRRENSVLIGGRYRNVSSKHAPRLSRHREKGRRYNSKNVKMARYAFVAQKRCEIVTKFSIEWLPPNLVYFTEEKKRIEQQALLLTALLEIRMPVLLYTPMRIYKALKKSEVTTNLLSPENVIDFMLKSQDESSRCVIGKLPIQLGQSNIQNESNLRSIFQYCKSKLEELPSNLEGLPLLLTADNMLRAFTANSPVYCTEFIDLFPDKASRFVHLQFVPLLLSFCEVDEAELGIIRHLTITSLAEEFMPDVFRDKLPLGETKHVPWSYPENGVLSKEWFRILWKFLKTVERSEREDTIPLLGKYPIIPTKDGKLATVDNSKSVLAMTIFKTKSLNSLQRPVAKILEDLSCPFLDESITEYGLPVVLPLVAHPDSESDVLHVLDYMNSTGILDLSKFDDEKIFTLLKFFQADCGNETSMGKAKTLPFYKGVDGNYYSLLLHSSYIKIPARLPEDGIRELQSIYGTRVLLFPSSLPSELNQLFAALGIEVNCRVSEFYIKYVLPNFSLLSRECQIKFLTCIRGTLRFDLIEELKWTRCIPDQTGNLCFASRYLNPHNELFQAMFKTDADVFPASPFNEMKWLEFLLQIGMKEKCDQEQFIEFANNVEQSAQKLTEYDENIIAQSKALVKYLLGNERDGTWSFYGIPEIKFIVPKEIEEELSSIHPQHRADGILEFVSYRDSVPWDLRHLIWTSYKLLPDWAFPRHNESLISALGITSEPPLNAVFQHIETMSNCASKIIVSGSTLSEKLKEVFKTTYEFLVNLMKHCAKEPSSDCNEKCQKIGECLKSVACILLNEERCLVRGEKLSIEDTKDKLKPHFYKIPRDYAPFDHLLKRLGATEKISASQMASVLKSIKDSSTDEKMNSEEEEKACFATSVLFKSLLDDKETEADSRLANCEELLLPSMAKRLISSDKLVCKMQPRLRESVAKQGYEILMPFEKCGMKRELENDYLQALPNRLRPTPLSELVREELHPLCKKDMSCTLCLAMDYHSFIQKVHFTFAILAI
ncbi:sacsin-like [Dendronephthya gigantea]|uniref:sacsin-like n=1 Tax=Dendronephthya gigantea TaxID=151771 RepID=UPI001068F864|nr:sacsin-like [Dendronephthya gigantea]